MRVCCHGDVTCQDASCIYRVGGGKTNHFFSFWHCSYTYFGFIKVYGTKFLHHNICLQHPNVEICWLSIFNVPHPGYKFPHPGSLCPTHWRQNEPCVIIKKQYVKWNFGLHVTAVLLPTSFEYVASKISEMVCIYTPLGLMWFILPPKIFLCANPPKT